MPQPLLHMGGTRDSLVTSIRSLSRPFNSSSQDPELSGNAPENDDHEGHSAPPSAQQQQHQQQLVLLGPGHAHIFDPASQQLTPLMVSHRSASAGLALLVPRGAQGEEDHIVASISDGVGLCLHGLTDGHLHRRLGDVAGGRAVTAFAAASAAGLLALGHADGSVRLLHCALDEANVEDGPLVVTQVDHALILHDSISALAMDMAGSTLAVAARSQVAILAPAPARVCRLLLLPSAVGVVQQLEICQDLEGSYRLLGVSDSHIIFTCDLSGGAGAGLPPTRDRSSIDLDPLACGLRFGRLPNAYRGERIAFTTDRAYVPCRHTLLTFELASLVPAERALAKNDSLSTLKTLKPSMHHNHPSLRGPAAAAVNATGDLVMIGSSVNAVCVALTRSSAMLEAPLRLSLGESVVLTAANPAPRMAWSLDGSRAAVLNAMGEVAVMGWVPSEEGQHQLEQVAAQATAVAPQAALLAASFASVAKAANMAADGRSDGTSKPRVDDDGRSLLEQAQRAAEAAALRQNEGSQEDLMSRIQALRTRLLQMIEDNESKPEEERLQRNDYVLDLAEKERLAKETESAVRSLREETELKMLEYQFLRNNIKQECWNTMEEQGRVLYALTSSLEVRNFPLRRRSPEELAKLKEVENIRRIELAVDSAVDLLRPATQGEGVATDVGGVGGQQPGASGSAAAAPRSTADGLDDVAAEGDGQDGGAAAAAAEAPGEADPAAGGERMSAKKGKSTGAEGATEREDYGPDPLPDRGLLYTSLHLSSEERKHNQILLLQDRVRQVKLMFNKEFEEAMQAKREDLKKVEKFNERIEKICEELRTTSTLYTPTVHILETPERLLEVRDDEITVPRVLTEEQQRAKEEAERAEAERRAAAAADNAHERGINDMMFGRLEGKDGNDVWIDPPKPVYLDSVPKDQWDEDQKRGALAYEATMKQLLELRDKRRKTLDTQLRNLYAKVDATREAFDARLNRLFERRIYMEQAVARDELAVLKLAKLLQDEQAIKGELATVDAKLGDIQLRRQRAAQTVSVADDVVAEVRGVYEEMVAHDRAIEKAFKARRELADQEPYIDILFRLYRRRPKRTAAKDYHVPPLDRERDFPEGLEDRIWQFLVQARAEKIENEALVFAKGDELAEAQAYLSRRQAELEETETEWDSTLRTLQSLQDARVDLRLNTETLITVRQGHVELHHDNDFDPDFEDAILIPRSAVESLNGTLRKLGKVRALGE